MKFKYIDAYGAHVYMDPLSRYLIKMAESLTPIQANPCMKYQGDLYMREDGTCYVVTMDPKNTDKLGNQIPLR